MLSFSLLTAFFGGLLSFVSPCVLPLVPGYISYIAGVPMSEADEDTPLMRSKLLSASFFFVAGFSLIFIALGAGASAIAPILQSYQGALSKIAGIVIILMGIHMLGIFRLSFLYKEFRLSPEISQFGSVFTPFLLGMAFGLGWTPCIGPILAGILVLASQQDTIAQGMILLSAYAAGLGIPFLLAAASLSYFKKKSNILKQSLGTIEKVSGGFLILTGFFIFTGSLQKFGGFLLDYFPFLVDFG